METFSSILQLRSAAMAEVDPGLRMRMYSIASALSNAIVHLAHSPTASNLEIVNGLWSHASAIYRARTPLVPDATPSGVVDMRKAA